jgi:segregation and condensation protein B
MTEELSSAGNVPARELKQVLGALVFGANRPVSIREIRGCLDTVGRDSPEEGGVFAQAKDSDVRRALDELADELKRINSGFSLGEVAGGFRLQSDPACGMWLRSLLEIDKPQRLSRPSLETLAIVAYRQPVTKGEIEAIRGVNVDHVIKLLMEMQLVKISGRSDLPGRPFLYSTTTRFLEHFGLRALDDLAQMEPMLAQGPRFTKRASKQAELDLRSDDAGPVGETPAAGEGAE